eukprot:CAMPEP_0195016944 /NCGR_PEP_ID=MMETSP0326_2-20130528/25872_1 /TAXON_ID=2866 ORGANISM="Crypthecodinium cohnii, Strain Seligo" /NCGR_SAMPLE_ID=MMETSP0326_2 /ASSEMBLY_ACC=CAM_ASM_000348 /LENGTH=143 /DNA_ID=CAMNT_0040033027 /DNA_START=626 /DNA_END=1053 /DNA_ORIENTATION=+
MTRADFLLATLDGGFDDVGEEAFVIERARQGGGQDVSVAEDLVKKPHHLVRNRPSPLWAIAGQLNDPSMEETPHLVSAHSRVGVTEQNDPAVCACWTRPGRIIELCHHLLQATAKPGPLPGLCAGCIQLLEAGRERLDVASLG